MCLEHVQWWSVLGVGGSGREQRDKFQRSRQSQSVDLEVLIFRLFDGLWSSWTDSTDFTGLEGIPSGIPRPVLGVESGVQFRSTTGVLDVEHRIER